MIQYGLDLRVNANQVFSMSMAIGVFAVASFLYWQFLAPGYPSRRRVPPFVGFNCVASRRLPLGVAKQPEEHYLHERARRTVFVLRSVDKNEYCRLQQRLKNDVRFNQRDLKQWFVAEHRAIGNANRQAVIVATL